MATRFANPAPRFFYDNGEPLSSGKMYFFEPGTSTPKNTYSDNALSVPNTNPVILSGSGLLPNVFLDGAYRVILTDKDDVQQSGYPRDSVNSIVGVPFEEWDSTINYGMGGINIVYASDGQYYVSIQNNNQGHDPTSSPLWWEPLADFVLPGQTVVPDGFVAVGSATTGLAGIDMTAKGGLLVGDGTTAPQVLPVGTDNFVLAAASAETTGVAWVSLGSLQPPDYQEFTGSGTWNKPTGATLVYVEGIGAGGSGAASNGAGSPDSAGGGGGGLFVNNWFLASALTSTVAVTIGAGASGVATGNNGGAGGDTTFGGYLTAPGGGPGLVDASTAFGGLAGGLLGSLNNAASSITQPGDYAGGAGGISGNASASKGGNSVKGGAGGGAAGTGISASGGTSLLGGNGGAGSNAGNATAGTAPGGGGGATSNNGSTSGAGAAGRLRVWAW